MLEGKLIADSAKDMTNARIAMTTSAAKGALGKI